MRSLKYIIVVCIAATFVSCEHGNKQPVSLRYSCVYPVDTAVSVELLTMEEPITSGQLLRLGDRFVVRGDYNMIQIYSYPNLRFLHKQELSDYASVTSDGIRLYCEREGNVDVYQFGERDSLYLSDSFSIAKAPYSIGTVQQLNKDSYIYSDMYDFRGKNEFHIMDIRTNQRISKGDYPEDDTRFKKLMDFKSAYMHSLAVKPDKSAFIVVYSQLRRIRIYDNVGSLQQDVFLDYSPGNYKIVPKEYERRYWHFGKVFTTDNYIYILNPDKLGQAPNEPRCNIIVLDWQGNLITRYRLNVWVTDFFVDESKNMIFGNCWATSNGNSFFFLNILDI